MIISGGVNIYPQETENHLIMHPKVHDVAVIGVPNEEMGEEVKAVVVPARGRRARPELERELIAFCRAGIAHYKCPRTIDFVDASCRAPRPARWPSASCATATGAAARSWCRRPRGRRASAGRSTR